LNELQYTKKIEKDFKRWRERKKEGGMENVAIQGYKTIL
jgi:hypothetical protein